MLRRNDEAWADEKEALNQVRTTTVMEVDNYSSSVILANH